MKILRTRGHERAVHPLALQPQHHDDIGAIETLAHVACDLDAHTFDARRQQGGRCNDADARTHRIQQDDVGTRDARMQYVAANRDQKPFEPALVAANGQRVEQRLGRMLVRAVAGIDDRTVHLPRQQFHCARRMMAHHQNVRMHGVQRHRGVDQCLALSGGHRRHRHVHDVGAEAFAGDLERGLGSRRGFEEQVDLGTAAQRRALLVDLAVQLDVFFGKVEEAGDVGGGKALDAQQMPVSEDKARFRWRCH